MALTSLIIIFSYITLVTQSISNEITAEALPLFFLLIFLLANQKNTLNKNFSLNLFLLILLSLYMFISTILFNGINGSLIFSYQIIFLILSLLISIPENFNTNRVYISIGLISAITSLISIIIYYYLFDGLNIPLIDLNIQSDSGRARGLSRSTLNYSSLSLLGLLATLQIRNNTLLKHILLSLILLGIIISKSRGALLPALVALTYFSITYYKKKNILFLIIVVILIFNLLPTWFYERFASSFNFYSERSNVDRLYSYSQFFENFTFHGMGYGSTGPAALRFNEHAIGFESYLLQFLYQSGFIGIFLLCFFY